MDDNQVLSRFRFVNWLDFIQYQKFDNLESEQAFKILYYYYLFGTNLYKENDEFIKKRIDDEFNQILEQIPQNICDLSKIEISKVKKLIKRRFFKNKINYRYLFIAEIIYTYRFLGREFNKNETDLWSFFEIKKEKKIDKFWERINNPSLIKNKNIRNSFYDLNCFVASQHKYMTQKVFNIGVCATMSAGKSTFVNALLGSDYLPSRNEATTACITSVYDNDKQSKMIGFAAGEGGTLEISDNLVLKNIDEWNSNENVKHIFLQADLDAICSEKVICAVHDTPGTNNSSDKNHHDITIRFLKENRMDALIYVANATQLCTQDERLLLSELCKKIVQPNKLPVIFVLNKADELDESKENIDEIISRYKAYLLDIGFDSSVIFPVSSKAARLLKMIQKGMTANLTSRETRTVAAIQEQYKDISSTGIVAVEQYIGNLF